MHNVEKLCTSFDYYGTGTEKKDAGSNSKKANKKEKRNNWGSFSDHPEIKNEVGSKTAKLCRAPLLLHKLGSRTTSPT